jgi:hypothetical protein
LRHFQEKYVCVFRIDVTLACARPLPETFCNRRGGRHDANFDREFAMMVVVILGCTAHAGGRDEAKVIMPDNPNTLKAWASCGFGKVIVAGDAGLCFRPEQRCRSSACASISS